MSSGGILTYKPERLDEYVAAVYKVLALNQVAFSCGTPKSTFKDWIKWGQEDIRNEIPSDLAKLSAAIKKAQTECIGKYINVIANREQNWQANAWLLERVFAEDYGSHGSELQELREEFEKLREHFEGKK